MLEKQQVIEQGERLKKVRKYLGFTQTDLAQKLDVTQAHYSAMEKGIRSIAHNILMQLSQVLPDLDLHWLLKGEGSMLRSESETKAVLRATQTGEPVVGYLTTSDQMKEVMEFLKSKFPDFKLTSK